MGEEASLWRGRPVDAFAYNWTRESGVGDEALVIFSHLFDSAVPCPAPRGGGGGGGEEVDTGGAAHSPPEDYLIL